MDLTEAEDIKKWSENKDKLYKRDLHDLDNLDAFITQSQILWALESITMIKASRGERNRVELFLPPPHLFLRVAG